jgi:hypothetical protein
MAIATLTDPNDLRAINALVAEANTDITAAAAVGTAAATASQPKTGNTFAVAALPAAASNVGRVVYCTNGKAGAACAAISDGTNWKVIDIGLTASAV